jgi:hypothetical protein
VRTALCLRVLVLRECAASRPLLRNRCCAAVESGREGVFVPVALFAPVSTLALSRPPADREETCDPSAHLLIVTADSTGVIRVFENNARKPLALHK